MPLGFLHYGSIAKNLIDFSGCGYRLNIAFEQLTQVIMHSV